MNDSATTDSATDDASKLETLWRGEFGAARRHFEEAITRYNEAWNAHDLDAIMAMHAPDMVFENHTAGEAAEGEAARGHIGAIFETWPDINFSPRRLYVRDGLVVQEWTATATHVKRLTRGDLVAEPAEQDRGVEPRVLGEDRGLQLPQLMARFEPELFAQDVATVLEDAQRVRLAAGPVQAEHQLGPQPFAERELAHQ